MLNQDIPLHGNVSGLCNYSVITQDKVCQFFSKDFTRSHNDQSTTSIL